MTNKPAPHFSYRVKSLPPSRATRAGFTLTEIAIVLGIVGIVLGAIWVAFNSVSQNNKVATAQQEMAFILSNYKALYAAHGVDVIGADVTCNTAGINGVADGFFPPSMGGTGCVLDALDKYPVNPWGGYVRVLVAGMDTQTIEVDLAGLPQDACVQLATQVPATPDIYSAWINPPLGEFTVSAGTIPISPAAAAGRCSKPGNSNILKVFYKAR